MSRYFTEYVGSDRYPFEVIERLSKTRVNVRLMDFDASPYSECCSNYRSNENHKVITISKRKQGYYAEVGTSYPHFKPTSAPSAYRDPTF